MLRRYLLVRLSTRRFVSNGPISQEGRNWLESQVRKFDVNGAVERAKTPPTTWYTSDFFHEFEKKVIFNTNYWAVDSMHRLEQPNSFVTACLGDERYLLTRTEDGQLFRGFFNVCSHHGTKVEWKESGVAETFCCPYHGWTYDTSGRLIKATRLRKIENFSAKCNGLEEVDVYGHWPIAFVKPRRSFESEFANVSRLRSMSRKLDRLLEKHGFAVPVGDENYAHVERREYQLKCNWKVFVDNYLDGGYHVKYAHKDLAGLLESKSYKIEAYPHRSDNARPIYQWSAQTSTSSSSNPGDSRVGQGTAYIHIYPNVMLNFYGSWIDVNYVLPTGPESCKVVFDWFVNRQYINSCDKATRQSVIADNLKDSEKVQNEDIELCERVQEGNRCSAFTQGRYAPNVEFLMHNFHKRLATEYLGYFRNALDNCDLN